MDQCLTAFFFSLHFISLNIFFLSTYDTRLSELTVTYLNPYFVVNCLNHAHISQQIDPCEYSMAGKTQKLENITYFLSDRRRIIKNKWIICLVDSNLVIHICFICSQFGVYIKDEVPFTFLVLGMNTVMKDGIKKGTWHAERLYKFATSLHHQPRMLSALY